MAIFFFCFLFLSSFLFISPCDSLCGPPYFGASFSLTNTDTRMATMSFFMSCRGDTDVIICVAASITCRAADVLSCGRNLIVLSDAVTWVTGVLLDFWRRAGTDQLCNKLSKSVRFVCVCVCVWCVYVCNYMKMIR